MKVSVNEQIEFSTLCYGLVAMLICFVPHLMDVAWVVLVMAGFALAYRSYSAFYVKPPLPSFIKVILVLLSLFLLRVQYGVLFSSSVLIDMLLMFYWLKVIEVYKRRDLRLLMLASLFVVFTVLIRFSELWVFPYMLVALFFNILFMFKVDVLDFNLSVFSRMSGRLILIILPCSMLLFFIFPRINSPLWHMPNFNDSKTGFSETLTPGEMTSLAQDFSTAFRVQYHGGQPKDSYWRGLVLSAYDGVSWQHVYRASDWTKLPTLKGLSSGMVELLLEPHQSRWLFYQGRPTAAYPAMRYSEEQGLTRLGGDVVEARLAYALNDAPLPYQALSVTQLKHNTFVPAFANPELKAWAKNRFIEQGQDVSRFVASIAAFIHEQPFWYRLNPRPIGQDIKQLDRFWFVSREGYCETYASAAAFILRSVGIPARVIVGYHGGVWNPLASYLTIRQADAHAWIEYWQEGKGWQRFDPTAAIDKARIEEALANRLEPYEREHGAWISANDMSWLSKVKMSWDGFKYGLERWFLFYNESAQQTLVQSLGLSWTGQALMSFFWLSLLLIFFAIGGYLFWRHRQLDPLTRAIVRFNRALQSLKRDIKPSMTFFDKCLSIAEVYPHLAQKINTAYARYELLRLQSKDQSKIQHDKIILLLNELTKLLNKEKR